jgi:Transposase DDE domain
MTTSKSPRLIAIIALHAALDALPLYRHRCSPKKYAQPQLLACLVLKEFFRTDYRGITAILADMPELRHVLRLSSVPHYTTLQKASRELLLRKKVHALIASILAMATEDKLMRKSVRIAAMDGTGLDSHHASRYFVERRRTIREPFERARYVRFPKMGVVCDTENHLVLAGVPEQGPQFDRTHYTAGLRDALKQKPIDTVCADAVYDSEKHHAIAHELGVRVIIPPKMGRHSEKPPSTPYRRKMALHFPKVIYRKRAQVETVISMLKRNFGSFTRARSFHSRCREILLRLFVHNVTIVRPV